MKKLTQAEEQIMQAVWNLPNGGFIKDVLEILDDPKPHHNTVATLLKILVEKKYVGIRNPNRNNYYYSLIKKDDYSVKRIEGVAKSFFEGSYFNVVSFLVDKKQMSIKDLELILKQLKKKK